MNDVAYNEFLAIFLDEAEDVLTQWERICLDLERQPTQQGFDALFRAAHNLKGSSRSVGLEQFGQFVHAVEDLIGLIKTGQLAFGINLNQLFLNSHAFLVDWIQKLHDNAEYVDTSAMQSLMSALNQAQHHMPLSALPIPTSTPPNQISNANVVDEVIPNSPPQANDSKVTRVETLRISTTKIDELMQYIGELSIHLSIIWEARQTNSLESDISKNAIYFCHKIIKDLQSQSLSLRMQPLQGFFQRMERTVKDVARTLNKNVLVKFHGETVELDKTVIERITDAFVHMLRNAVDHGIESPDVRIKNGKSSQGKVIISAVNQANTVTITVSDDGQGLDADRILEKAVEKGLVNPNKSMSQSEIYRLVLLPGFSTAQKLTEISGRGVGMDVVSKSILELGGTLDIDSKKGAGTTFKINLPTSLSILDSLVVVIDGLKYAVPIQDISEVIDLNAFKIETTTLSTKMISIRGQIVPVQELHDYLKLLKRPDKPRSGHKVTGKLTKIRNDKPALIIKSDSQNQVAFTVDQITGHQSVVVRKLMGKFEKMQGIIGSTILGDGEPGMILSLPQLARKYTERSRLKEAKHG